MNRHPAGKARRFPDRCVACGVDGCTGHSDASHRLIISQHQTGLHIGCAPEACAFSPWRLTATIDRSIPVEGEQS